jgi:tetratricopeptide (TPR) repeat protein
MAPEQRQGLPVDARADQYSFCVTLWSALYGALPEDAELPTNAADVATSPGQPRQDVPTWLRRLLERGLQRDPAGRFGSMHELLAALERGTRPRTRARWAALVALVLVTGAVVAVIARPAASAPCEGAPARVAAVWNESRKARLRAGFAASKRPYAGRLADHVIDELDRHARSWAGMHRDACLATRVTGEQSAQLLELRQGCLDRRLTELASLVDVFIDAPGGEVVDGALEAATHLPALASCADVESLTAVVPIPKNLAVRARIIAVEAQLGRAAALDAIGDPRRGLPLARSAAETALELHHAPLLAAALLRQGRLERSLADYAAAEATFDRGLVAAAEARDVQVEAEIWVNLLILVGAEQQRPREGLALRRAADASLIRAGNPGPLRLQLLLGLVSSLLVDGRYTEALAVATEALQLAQREYGPDHLETARVLDALANVTLNLREYGLALDYARRALAIRSAQLGEAHPTTAMAMNRIGQVLLDQPDSDPGAQLWFERSRSILEATLGPDNPLLADPLTNLAIVLRRQGELEAALAASSRALAIDRTTHGSDSPDLGHSLTQNARILIDLQRFQEAYNQEMEAAAVFERTLGADHPYRANPLILAAKCSRQLGRFDEAVALTEEGLAIRTRRPEYCTQPWATRIHVANALWDRRRGNDRGRAVELVREAQRGIHACGKDPRNDLAIAAGWLAERHLPPSP